MEDVSKNQSPSQFYRSKRPEFFSDSSLSYEFELPREVLAFELEKISTNQKQDQFEALCCMDPLFAVNRTSFLDLPAISVICPRFSVNSNLPRFSNPLGIVADACLVWLSAHVFTGNVVSNTKTSTNILTRFVRSKL